MINYWAKYKKELFYCSLSGCIGIIAAYFFLGLNNIDLTVPFSYSLDALHVLRFAQNYVTGGGRFYHPNMGAPGTFTMANWPDVFANTAHMGMWFLSLFINCAGLLVNVFYICTFATISIAATLSLRLLRVAPSVSIMGGVLYSLLPYHLFRGIYHLWLSEYSIVPLACVLILWIMNGELSFNNPITTQKNIFKKIPAYFNRKIAFSLIIAIFIGLATPPYMMFACLGIIFALGWNFLETRDIKKTLAPAVVLVMIFLTVAINFIPYFLTVINNMESALIGTRSSRDVELFSLKLIQLILPTLNHRIPLFERITSYYYNHINISFNENAFSSLGLLMSIGFLASLYIAMSRRKSNLININVKNSSILNVFMLLLGSVGGFASLIAFFTSTNRAYNRISLFIAFYALFISCRFLSAFFKRYNFHKSIVVVLVVVIGVLSSFDQVSPVHASRSRRHEERFNMHRMFIEEIEYITPEGSMIFQLPFLPFDHHVNYNAIDKYELFIPFIHSNSLRWSYTAQSRSAAERWQRKVSNMETGEMMKHLAAVGFRGLYIDTFGFSEEKNNEMRYEIVSITGVTPIVSKDGRMVYFYLGDYFEILLNTLSENERRRFSSWDNCLPIIISQNYGKIYNSSNQFGGMLTSGWSSVENWGVWSNDNVAKISFATFDKSDLTINMHFDVFPNPLFFSIYVNNVKVNDYVFSGSGHSLTLTIFEDYLIESGGLYNVVIRFNIENPKSPGADPRILGIGLHRLIIDSN